MRAAWLPEIRYRAAIDHRVLLVGTKADLRRDECTLRNLADKNMAPIEMNDAIALAKAEHMHAYVETSALTLMNVKGCFSTAMDMALNMADTENSQQAKQQTRCILM